MADTTIETPLSSGATDQPGVAANEASAKAAGYAVQHADPNRDWFASNAPTAKASASSDWFASNAPKTGPKQAQSYATQDAPMSTSDAVKGVVGDTWDAVKGAAKMFDPRMQPGETALTVNPAARMIKGVMDTGKQAMEVPAAIRDINASPDPLSAYAGAAQRTASQGAGQAIVGAATEGARLKGPDIARAAVRNAPTVGRTVGGITGAAVGHTVAGTEGAVVGGLAGRELGGAAGEALKSKFPDYSANTVKPTDFVNSPSPLDPVEAPDATGQNKAYAGENIKTPKPQAAGDATGENKAYAGEKSPAATANGEHPQAQAFEKLFNQPLENYMQDGKFQTKDFLNEVVKPKLEPPNHVMARTFGAESVPMIEELAGKPLAKWESTAPTGEAQGGTARLRSKVAAAKAAPESPYADRQVAGETSGEVPARGFLKKVGADENSVLNGAGRTPGEHADSIAYHRDQIKAGTSQPVELHVDEQNNVIGADGRHRALAAIQEGGPDAKVNVKIVKHSFQGPGK